MCGYQKVNGKDNRDKGNEDDQKQDGKQKWKRTSSTREWKRKQDRTKWRSIGPTRRANIYITVAAVITVAAAAEKYTTPVPILKQIDKQNEDGSYTYGYEAADGTFKIETKYPDGEVYGKYGYIDDTGSLREVEYGASRRGFEPAGNEIQVAPPTLKVNTDAIARPLAPNEEDDGQYREDPSYYYKNDPYYQPPAQRAYDRPVSRYQDDNFDFDSFGSHQPQTSYKPRPAYRPAYTRPEYDPEPYTPETEYRPAYQPQPQPAYRPQTSYRPSPPAYNPPSYYSPPPPPPPPPQQPAFRPQPSYYNPPPAYNNYGPSFNGHPAQNVDINTGSYTVQYKR
ncbi:hypothetical protein NQ315_002549 [Exocentrus adspersus]|uniref:Uncharacterized protein n=1 Tax=Exocentrus adspersus TaxID=1586481 RepID=A0AAV8VFC7_9CUCU|nr:hypothetical protein NQ315_002549 [Exocentrus adspersus]